MNRFILQSSPYQPGFEMVELSIMERLGPHKGLNIFQITFW